MRTPATQVRTGLLLLLALVGGLGASSVHQAHHALERAAQSAAHQATAAHADGDHVAPPCRTTGGADLDCAVCGGLQTAPLAAAAAVAGVESQAEGRPADETRAGVRYAATPGRGPPAEA